MNGIQFSLPNVELEDILRFLEIDSEEYLQNPVLYHGSTTCDKIMEFFGGETEVEFNKLGNHSLQRNRNNGS